MTAVPLGATWMQFCIVPWDVGVFAPPVLGSASRERKFAPSRADALGAALWAKVNASAAASTLMVSAEVTNAVRLNKSYDPPIVPRPMIQSYVLFRGPPDQRWLTIGKRSAQIPCVDSSGAKPRLVVFSEIVRGSMNWRT